MAKSGRRDNERPRSKLLWRGSQTRPPLSISSCEGGPPCEEAMGWQSRIDTIPGRATVVRPANGVKPHCPTSGMPGVVTVLRAQTLTLSKNGWPGNTRRGFGGGIGRNKARVALLFLLPLTCRRHYIIRHDCSGILFEGVVFIIIFAVVVID